MLATPQPLLHRSLGPHRSLGHTAVAASDEQMKKGLQQKEGTLSASPAFPGHIKTEFQTRSSVPTASANELDCKSDRAYLGAPPAFSSSFSFLFCLSFLLCFIVSILASASYQLAYFLK